MSHSSLMNEYLVIVKYNHCINVFYSGKFPQVLHVIDIVILLCHTVCVHLYSVSHGPIQKDGQAWK